MQAANTKTVMTKEIINTRQPLVIQTANTETVMIKEIVNTRQSLVMWTVNIHKFSFIHSLNTKTMPGLQHSQPTKTLLGQGRMRVYV